MSYPPKAAQNGSRHLTTIEELQDAWPGDTYTNDYIGVTYRLGRDGVTWEIVGHSLKSTNAA